jgi:hypothetical protein
MRLKTLVLALGLVVVLAPAADAKYIVTRVTITGPGMDEPAVLKRQMVVNVMSNATLVSSVTPRVIARRLSEPPADLGPAYELEYRFDVGDNNGSSTQFARQHFYPFAAEGPVVFTQHGQKVEMSFGNERFLPGWFEVDARMLPDLDVLGMPSSPPVTDAAGSSTPATPAPPSSPLPLVAVAIALVAGGAIHLRTRLA